MSERIRVQSSGGLPRRLLVKCPRGRGLVRLEHCLDCEQSLGLQLEGADHAYVQCRTTGEKAPAPRGARYVPVSSIMTRDVVSLPPDAPIEHVVWLLSTRGFGGAPVVDEHGDMLGIVSIKDLLRHQLESPPPGWDEADAEEIGFDASGVTVRSLSGQCARDVMSPVVLTIPASTPVAFAAALMSFERIHRLPVVDDGAADTLVGIVSSLDVMRFVGREHGFIVPDRRGDRARRETTESAGVAR